MRRGHRAALVGIGEAFGSLHGNTAKAVVLFWAEPLSEGRGFRIGRLQVRLLGTILARAPDEGRDGLLRQAEVRVGLVEDVVGDLKENAW